jgi:hypothetical protein
VRHRPDSALSRRRPDLLSLLLAVVTFGCCGLIGLLGIAIAGMGLYAFVVGIHGGPVTAGIILLIGATLAFLSYYLARLFARSELGKPGARTTSNWHQ